MEATPKISPIFAILEPITFPTTSPDSAFKLAKILTISSGKDVQKATNVIPIIILDILKLDAITLLLSIKYSAP